MGPMASQITSLTIVYSTVYSGTYQRKHQSSVLLGFVQGIHRWPVNSPHKWPVTRKMFPFDDVIMTCITNTVQIDAYGSCFVVFWRGWFAPVQFYPHLSGLHHRHRVTTVLVTSFIFYVYIFKICLWTVNASVKCSFHGGLLQSKIHICI